MLEAMALLDKIAKKVLFVMREDKFVASLTDGDIRRWILKKGNLDARVVEIANYNPMYLFENERNKAKSFMKKNSIEAVPIVNQENTIISVVLRNAEEIELQKLLDIQVVIMAGGLGTRLYPYTKILPKPLIPIGEIPIVEHIINKFNQSGANHFFLVVNHKKNMIKAYFNEITKNYVVNYVDEEQPLGTGGGLSLLKGKITSTFVLTNCDVLINENYEKILEYHKSEKNLITMVCSLKHIKIPYGVIEISETGEIQSMKEKPEMSFFVNTGVYIVDPRVIDELKENVSISFPQIIEYYRNQGERIGMFPISENNWLDMGEFDQLEEMKRRLKADE